MSLKNQIQEDMKAAMKARQSERLAAIRLLLAAIKQKEVDERIELDDSGLVLVIEKMLKQRRDSFEQYQAAGRTDLAQREQSEIDVLQTYLPTPLTEDEIEILINEALAASGAKGVADMGKVIGVLRPELVGRADMGAVSARVKARLSAL